MELEKPKIVTKNIEFVNLINEDVFTIWKTDKPITKIKSCKLCNKKWNKEQTIKQHTSTELHLKSKLKVIDNDKVKEGDKFFKKGQSILNKDFKLAITCLWEGVKRYQQSQNSGSLFNGLFHLIELLTENRKKELITMSILQMNQMLFVCYRTLFNLIYCWDLELGLKISALALESKFGIKLMEYNFDIQDGVLLKQKMIEMEEKKKTSLIESCRTLILAISNYNTIIDEKYVNYFIILTFLLDQFEIQVGIQNNEIDINNQDQLLIDKKEVDEKLKYFYEILKYCNNKQLLWLFYSIIEDKNEVKLILLLGTILLKDDISLLLKLQIYFNNNLWFTNHPLLNVS